MSYNNETRSSKSNDHKQHIIECALKLIEEKGFDGVSVAEITKSAGVSKGAFYIHFKSKEDLVEQEIQRFYNDLILDDNKTKQERLSYFVLESIKRIQEAGLKLCQQWFSQSVKGNFYGKSKLNYDLKTIKEIVNDDALSQEIVSAYYGALNLWCFSDGEISPSKIMEEYLNALKERI